MSTTPPEDPDPGSWEPPPAADPPPSAYPPPYEPPEQPPSAYPPSSYPPAGSYPPPSSPYGGYQQPGYQQPGYQGAPYPGAAYGANPYGYQAPQDHPQGTTILVLGILSLVLGLSCGIGFLAGPVAWIMGNGALREIDASPVPYGNRGQVQAGRICGIVSTAILALGLAFVVFIVAVSAGSST